MTNHILRYLIRKLRKACLHAYILVALKIYLQKTYNNHRKLWRMGSVRIEGVGGNQ